jgi:hypothetical protein
MNQDISGTSYEQLIAHSLRAIGFSFDTDRGANYLHPSPRRAPVIAGTTVQPDFVLRSGATVTGIVYCTHWSNKRNSKFKYWRTWEEECQQKIALGSNIIAINCVFEALPPGVGPLLVSSADELPVDAARSRRLPQQLQGWDPGVGWALVESFDISVVFPVEYGPALEAKRWRDTKSDKKTNALLRRAIKSAAKREYRSLWNVLSLVAVKARQLPRATTGVRSRYRIGLLHLYLLFRLFQRSCGVADASLKDLADWLSSRAAGEFSPESLVADAGFRSLSPTQVASFFRMLSQIPVRWGKRPEYLATYRECRTIASRGSVVAFAKVNADIAACLSDIQGSLERPKFVDALQRAFRKFDGGYGVSEAIEDLSTPSLVERKAEYVLKRLVPKMRDRDELAKALMREEGPKADRARCVPHKQNWALEMLLYFVGAGSTKDVQKRFQFYFETTGHKLRPHAPWGDIAATVIYLLQGRDITSHWAPAGRGRTLSEKDFRSCAWTAMAACLVESFKKPPRDPMPVLVQRYREAKAQRLIAAELNGLHIVLEELLGDLVAFTFSDEEDTDPVDGEAESTVIMHSRVCAAWQTQAVSCLWGGRPLETWMDGVSRDGTWLIKTQSAQDGNEGHKVKELAARARSLQVTWRAGADARRRAGWSFEVRERLRLALILDGDWSPSQLDQLRESGWDWVGGVGDIPDLRSRIAS